MSTSSAATRLALLEGYLEEDAGNEALREAAFEAATEAGQTGSAASLAEGALACGHAAGPWLHRLAHVWLAQGDAQRCLDLLRPHLSAGACSLDPVVVGPLQALWVRALHRSRRFEEAVAWTLEQEASGQLQPAAFGVASLLAWDSGLLEVAERFAKAAVLADADDVEGRVTLASLALMRRQNAVAEQHLQAALGEVLAERRARPPVLQREFDRWLPGSLPCCRSRSACPRTS
jgi:hypothetical protein